MSLVKYGILDDKSDYRIHVGFHIGRVYFFLTENAKELIRRRKDEGIYPIRHATQPGVNGSITGSGWCVPWSHVDGIKEIMIPKNILALEMIDHNKDGTSKKGDKAIRVCKRMLNAGRIPLPMVALEVQDYEMQIAGSDLIIVQRTYSIQVKCDAPCGGNGSGRDPDTNLGWTGNLFLQRGESNPFKQY